MLNLNEQSLLNGGIALKYEKLGRLSIAVSVFLLFLTNYKFLIYGSIELAFSLISLSLTSYRVVIPKTRVSTFFSYGLKFKKLERVNLI